MNVLLHPTYLPSIAHFIAIANATEVIFESQGSFQKQTYRNRAYIYGANGKLTLNIPVKHTQKNRQDYKDVKIANHEKWQDQHWKSIQSAYRTSPFFEFYEDDFRPLFNSGKDNLFEFNMECIEVICNCIDLEIEYNFTSSFDKDPINIKDLRHLVEAKKEAPLLIGNYFQVFSEKHGFLPNLSIIDLLFNEGPNTLNYLQSNTL
jgi:hypothetical protein